VIPELEPGEALFLRSDRYGWIVRVQSPDDLTDRHVEILRRDGSRTRVRLTRRLARATDDRPALWKFEQWTREQRRESRRQAR
jgi:hypothetical protein